MKTKRFICAALLFVAMVFAESASAQLKTSYFMEGSYFRTELNPALAPTRGYLGLTPYSGFTFGNYSNHNSLMTFYRDGQNVGAASPLVSFNDFIGRLPNKCKESYSYNINIFQTGFYTRNDTFWNIGSNIRLMMDGTIPKEYYKILKSDYTNGITAKDIRLNCDAYIENYIGRTFRIGDNITLGARAKFLVGLINMNIYFNEIAANNDKYHVDGGMKVAGYIVYSSDYNGEEFPEITDDTTIAPVFDNTKSFGGAIDLGAEVRLLDNHLKLSGAITDLGFIRWSKDTMMESTMTASFDKKSDVDNILGIMGDDLVEMPRFLSGYTTRLVTNINLGAEYNFLSNHFSVGALSSTRILHGSMMSELTTSLNVRPTNWISFTASYTLFNGNVPGVYGAAVNIHPKLINIFIGMDYMSRNFADTAGDILVTAMPFFTPFFTDTYSLPNSFNFYLGVGFNFGRPDFLID